MTKITCGASHTYNIQKELVHRFSYVKASRMKLQIFLVDLTSTTILSDIHALLKSEQYSLRSCL